MDQEIAELRQEIETLRAISVDTNKAVHGLRRNQRWHSFVSLLWWIIIIGTSVWSYYLLQPYIQKAIDAYGGIQQTSQNAQNLQQQAQDFLNKYLTSPTITP